MITGRLPWRAAHQLRCASECSGLHRAAAEALSLDEVNSFSPERWVRAPYSRELIRCTCEAVEKDDCACIRAHEAQPPCTTPQSTAAMPLFFGVDVAADGLHVTVGGTDVRSVSMSQDVALRSAGEVVDFGDAAPGALEPAQ